MPYNEHSLFTSPKDDDCMLWRYMDFTKFVSILSKKALFFPKARVLKKIDKWEGVWLQKELDWVYNYMLRYYTQEGNTNPKELADNFAKEQMVGNDYSLDDNFISCWHLNKVESAAMWRLYITSNEGIAIKTNVEKFKNCFKDYKRDVYIGEVRYKDYFKNIYYTEGDIKPSGWNGFLPYIHKRNNFEHEHEFRAVVWIPHRDIKEDQTEDGIFVPVDINILIDSIYVSPAAPEWFLSLVKDTLKQFDFNKSVFRSEMDDETCMFKNIE